MGKTPPSAFRVYRLGGAALAIMWMAGCGGGGSAADRGSNGGGGSANVMVSIAPKRAEVVVNTQVQQFTAIVSGDPQNLGVTWDVDGVMGGNATVGRISNSGLYTPPASGGAHTIGGGEALNDIGVRVGAVGTEVSQTVTIQHVEFSLFPTRDQKVGWARGLIGQ